MLVIRLTLATATVLPVGWLLGWIAAGEASHGLIRDPDLLNLYQGDLGASYHFFVDSWITRVLVIVILGLALERFVMRVRGSIGTVVGGTCLALASSGFLYAVTRYEEAETRLALSPYKSTFEDASWWLLPFVLVVVTVCGLTPWLEADGPS